MNRLNLLVFMRSLFLITCLVVWCFPAYAQQPEALATVWFYRDTDPSPLDPTLFKIVPSFAERLAVLKPDSYFALAIPAGVHRFSWTAAPAKGETLSLSIAAGQQVFIKVQFRNLERADEREAIRRMQTMEPITSPLAFDNRVSRRVFLPDPALASARDARTADGLVPIPPPAVTGSEAVPAEQRVETQTLPAGPTPERSVPPAPASAGTAASMTNDDVMMLVEAGFSRDLIVTKIRSSKTDFDTSPSELVLLKKAGVHDSIILLMIAAGAPSTSAPSPEASSTSSTSIAAPGTPGEALLSSSERRSTPSSPPFTPAPGRGPSAAPVDVSSGSAAAASAPNPPVTTFVPVIPFSTPGTTGPVDISSGSAAAASSPGVPLIPASTSLSPATSAAVPSAPPAGHGDLSGVHGPSRLEPLVHTTSATRAEASEGETSSALSTANVPAAAPTAVAAPAEPIPSAALDNRPIRRLSEPPKIISQPQVVYPEEARRDGVEGLVEVDVVMQPGGSIIGLQLVSSPHPILSETALQSVSRWQFEPPARDLDDDSNVVFRVAVKFAIQ